MKKSIIFLFLLFCCVLPESQLTKYLYIYDDYPHFSFSGYMGANNGSSLSVNLSYTTNPMAGVYCVSVSTSGTESWCALAVQVQPNLWTPPGLNFTGVTSCTFALKSLGPGGEKIKLKFMDDANLVQEYTLSTTWQSYTYIFPNSNFSSVTAPVTIIIENSQKISFLLDEIYLSVNRPAYSETEQAPREVTVKGLGYNSIDSTKYAQDFSQIKATLGANTLRFWSEGDYTHVTLDQAQEYGLQAIISFWLPRGDEGLYANYTDHNLREALKRSILNWLQFHLPHSAVKYVCLGNEVFHFLDPNTEANKQAFAVFMESMCQEIHAAYSVLVTHADAGVEGLPYFQAYTPSLDIFGSNSYGNIESSCSTYQASGYPKPIGFWEYGCLGWFEKDWNNYTNEERAADYLKHWRILQGTLNCLGGCAFTLLDKTEGPTPGYTGWGIVNNDRTTRPQFDKVKEAYAPVTPAPTPSKKKSSSCGCTGIEAIVFMALLRLRKIWRKHPGREL